MKVTQWQYCTTNGFFVGYIVLEIKITKKGYHDGT